jgi:hypothetical protein
MTEHGQSTVEYAGLALALLVLLFGMGAAARTRLASARLSGDAGLLQLASRYTPALTLESHGDGEVPVDFRRCRRPACARGDAQPVLFLHGVRRGGFLYLEYWEYIPDSRTAHTGIAAFDGYHHDDWEGVIVKLRPDGTVVGARASAHLGWNGLHPWWDLAPADWAPYPAPVYRASGSHAGSFRRSGIDVAGDAWDGDGRGVRPRLVPADQAREAGATFDPESVAPWDKEVWTDPEAVITGHPGDGAAYARYARWWADLCPIC